MVIYNQNENTLFIAENDVNMHYFTDKEEIYELGYRNGFNKGYEDGLVGCLDGE